MIEVCLMSLFSQLLISFLLLTLWNSAILIGVSCHWGNVCSYVTQGPWRNPIAVILEQMYFPLPQCPMAMSSEFKRDSDKCLLFQYSRIQTKLLVCLFSPGHLEKKSCTFNVNSTKSKPPRGYVIRRESLHNVGLPLGSDLRLVCVFLSFPHL